MEDVQQANEVLRKTDDGSAASTTTATTTTATTTTSAGSVDRNKLNDAKKSQDFTDSRESYSSNISDRLSSDSSVRRTQSSNESDLSSVSSWRRNRVEREDASKKDVRMMIKSLYVDDVTFFDNGFCVNREYVYSAVVYQKYLTRLRELIIFEPWRENYHFSQPS